MDFELRSKCAISGIGCTDFSRVSGRSVLRLAVEASLAAISDAGLTPDDVDGIVRCDYDDVQSHDLFDALGLKNISYWSTGAFGGTAPPGMVGLAAAAVHAGLARNVLVFRSLNGRSGTRYGKSMFSDPVIGGNGTLFEYFLPYGMATPGQFFGMVVRRHMEEYGTTAEQLGAIALTCRRRANSNPRAQMYERTLSMDDYLASRMVSDPLRLNDFCLETDGACAVLVTSLDRAKEGPHRPVVIRAVAQASMENAKGGFLWPILMRDSILDNPGRNVAKLLYQRAGIGPSDIDVAQIYDCFTITALQQIEDFGFCGRGEGGPFAASGALELDGSIPFNTAGGHLSEGYIHGMGHVLEGVRQIRRTSTQQVDGAETCLVTAGSNMPTSALILARE